MARRMANYVLIEGISIDLGLRDNIIKEQSLIHNQLSANIFHKMILYAFFKSGLSEHNPGEFLNVSQVCFPNEHKDCDICHNLRKPYFIKCSICASFLCFDHFFVDYHFHDLNDV